MFVYLSKKIAIPNNIRLRCVSYNLLEGYIACGGEDGLLKVLKLEAQIGKDPKVKGLAAPSNLSMNQPLEGHKGPVTVLTWNERNQKLTSGDQTGLIIVWVLHKGTWYEEMVNTRSKTVVRGMKWNVDGQRICIAYEDGAVIVGTVDGNRIWGKDLKDVKLSHLEWSPDTRLLLFGIIGGEVHIYDSIGNFISKMQLPCQTGMSGVIKVAAVEWYNGIHGYTEQNCPSLAICFDNGKCQLMRNELDEDPILLDTSLQIADAKWNHDGSMLAIAGSQRTADKEVNAVQFYNPFGEHLRTLKVPGKELSSCSFEGGSLRLALAIDSYIYFANIRPEYKWCYFAGTVVYSFTKADRLEHCVVFWDTKNNVRHVKFFKNLLSVTAYGDFCCVTTHADDITAQQYILTLCNSIGTALDTKNIDMVPAYVAMTNNHIVAASREAFYMWQFKSIKQLATIDVSGKRKAGTEKLYHVDDIPSGVGGDVIDFNKALAPTQDPICAVCISDKLLIVARESGAFNQYMMPQLSLTNKRIINARPHHLALNSISSRLAIIDVNGVLTFYDFHSKVTDTNGKEVMGELLKVERKDVWNMCWAEDNPEMFAMMEKTRLFIFRGLEPEEPINSSGYICQFKDLEVKSVFLDEMMAQPESANLENIVDMEAKSLRDARSLLDTAGVDDTLKFVEANPHARLWRLLAEYALEKLNLKVAEHCFVRCKDYAGIQFVKRLATIQNESIKMAEVATYFGRYDEAEKVYTDIDRKDMAVSLRKKLGDWFRVVQLLKPASQGVDQHMEEACNAIGDYYADKQQWPNAVTYYVQGRNQQRLAKCYYMLEDYAGLKTMTDHLPENHRLLPEIAEMFVTVGMCQEAVDAYLKSSMIQQAVDACIQLNQWNTAIELAKQHSLRDIDSLLTKYANLLMEQKKIFNAVELYRKANRHLDAARLLFQIAEKESKKSPRPQRMKKLYVLAGLLIEQYHEQMRTTQRSKTKKFGSEAMSALAGLLEEDASGFTDSKLIENAWHGAEAYHFYILAQKQLYDGQFDSAMKTAMQLRDFEDVLNPCDIYSLLGLASASVRSFGVCSKAFIKLESIESITSDQRKAYEELAIEVFIKHSPKDLKANKVDCTSCQVQIPDWSPNCPSCDTKFPTCVVTGRPILANQFWMCPTCKHRALEKEITLRRTCPMCHTKV